MLHFSVKVGEVAGKAIPQAGFATTGRTLSTRHEVVRIVCGARKGQSLTSRVAFLADPRACPACKAALQK
jgi:hypothetical protein